MIPSHWRAASLLCALVAILGAQQTKRPAAARAKPLDKAAEQKEDPVTTAWQLLTTAAHSHKASERTDALSALATMGPNDRAIELVEFSLDNKDSALRGAAVRALGEMKARQAIPRLREMLGDRSPAVDFEAAKALWSMGDASGKDLFFEILAGDRKVSPGVVGSEMADARKKLHDPKALAMIGINQGAGAFLGPFAMGITVAEALSKDNSSPARVIVAQILSSDRNPATEEQLAEALTDKSWVVRAAAARALGNCERREMIAKLAPLLMDDKEPVRLMAAASIIRLSATIGKPAA
ncbi:MAG: HEAT repeat domain-containing protein [Candidatus Acidiferrales bacterium]